MCRVLLIVLLSLAGAHLAAASCNRIPQGASGERSAVDDNFKILIDGNPTTYIPDHQYNVSLSCPVNLKFISFTLIVESEENPLGFNAQDATGHFELFNNAETRFSTGCENMVESTNTNAKTRIDVSWISPKQPDSGCVLIRAGVVQHRDVWFIDDGFLTKRICPEEIDELNSQTPTLQNCCACDEAKYEIILERKWARNTHAKHFPQEAWRTRLGEIIGASHSYNYRYWEYGGRASHGMKELAEHGATRTLEQEIRDNTQNGEVRTIIKAPGIEYRRNVYGTTLANARVDPQHHQISLAAKIDPSPDWILGVAGLELCLSNCTWLERKVLNLYPWDIGTDSGPSYMSPDQPQVPPDVIRRITSSYPSDHRSPFFDESGAPMKPLATLYLTRKKLYIRDCQEVPSQDGPLECATHPWNEWSNCSTRCGAGFMQRYRSYKNPALAANFNCNEPLEETRQCQGTRCGIEDELANPESERENSYGGPDTMAECELSTWTDWTPCSKPCGRGISTRRRDYLNPQARPRCQTAVRMPLEETRQCTGTDCGGTIPDNGELDGLQDLEPRPFGEISEGGFDSNRPSWGSNNLNRNPNQDWSGNNLASPLPAENPRGYDSSRRKLYELERSTPRTNYKEPLKGNQGLGYNDYKQDNRADGLNKLRQDNRADSYGTYRPDNREESYNDLRQNNRGNYNNFDPLSEQSNPLTRYGYTTRSPFVRYPERQQPSDAETNYNVVQDYCYEKPFASTQPCLANPVIVRNYWFYDHDDHECKIFTTDNCDENNNRFRTLMACEGTCLLPQINLARTDDPEENSYGSGPMQPTNFYGGGLMQSNNPYGSSAMQPRNPYGAGAMQPNNPYGAGAMQTTGVFDEGFGEPLSQTSNRNRNYARRGRYGS